MARSREPDVWMRCRMPSHTSPGLSWNVRTVWWPRKMLICSLRRWPSDSSSMRAMMNSLRLQRAVVVVRFDLRPVRDVKDVLDRQRVQVVLLGEAPDDGHVAQTVDVDPPDRRPLGAMGRQERREIGDRSARAPAGGRSRCRSPTPAPAWPACAPDRTTRCRRPRPASSACADAEPRSAASATGRPSADDPPGRAPGSLDAGLPPAPFDEPCRIRLSAGQNGP